MKLSEDAMSLRSPSAVLLFVITFFFFLFYLVPWNWNQLPSRHFLSQQLLKTFGDGVGKEVRLKEQELGLVPYRQIRRSMDNRFNFSSTDVLVILHIQKTGGTSFEKHVVQDLEIENPCICWKRRKRCKCPRPPKVETISNNTGNSEAWLFSRFSTGWICGLHADWTELTMCVETQLDKAYGSSKKKRRRYFYVTMIRDPIHRFLSEFRHVQRGATWKASRHICNGRYATADELGSCFSGRSWTGVTLKDFLNCPHNLAFNRQTRMLADLSLVGCYNKSHFTEEERNRVLLASAKQNLESMAFIGITEYQRISQYVFEETLKVRFRVPFTQNEDTYSKATLEKAKPEELEVIRKVNALDLELYAFADRLLHERFEELKRADASFADHYNFLGEVKGRHFSWDEVENEE